jgi:hypothetical protein
LITGGEIARKFDAGVLFRQLIHRRRNRPEDGLLVLG